MKTYTRHALSAVFIDPPESEYKAMVKDIGTNGLIEPVVTIGESEILDGWTRYKACLEAGVEPAFVRFEDVGNGMTPMEFAMSRNFYRKHLTQTVRACIAAEMFEGRFAKPGLRAEYQAPEQVTLAHVAKVARVSKNTLNAVRRLQRVAPATFAKLKSGEVADPAKVVRQNPNLRIQKHTHQPSTVASRALAPMLRGAEALAESLKLKPAEFAKQWAVWEGADKAKRFKAMKTASAWLTETIAAVEAQGVKP